MRSTILRTQLILALVLFVSCEDFFGTDIIEVTLPDIPQEYVSKHQSHWNVYYIGEQSEVSKSKVLVGDSIKLILQKEQNMPVLACMEYRGAEIQEQYENIADMLFYCPLAAGAVAPYDVFENTMNLDFNSKAQSAEILLFLYARAVNIANLNERKLFSTLENKITNTPVQKQEILQDIADVSLSYWSIKAKNNLKIQLETHAMIAKSTSMWAPHITINTKEIQLYYPGIWYFLDEENETMYYILISLQEEIISNFPFAMIVQE